MNIFRTLASGKHTFREEFVSAFLAYLLSPKMDHGLSFLVLSRLLEKIADKNQTGSLRHLAEGLRSQLWESIFDDGGPQPVVELEVSYGGGKGYIDIVVRYDNWFIMIENKIAANSKTDGQIKEQYEGLREVLRSKEFKDDDCHILVIYLVPAVQVGGGWSVPEGFSQELAMIDLQPGDKRVLVSWQPVSSAEEEPVSVVSLLREIIHHDACGAISPIGPDVRHALLSLVDFAMGEFKGFHYPKAAASRLGEPRFTVSEILSKKGEFYVGVKAGKAGAIDSAWKNPAYLSRQLTVTEDPNRGWQYLPLNEFKVLVNWALDPEGRSLKGVRYEGKPFFTSVLFRVAKWGESELWIGVKGGLDALREMSPEQIDERSWEVSDRKKSGQWFTGLDFVEVLEGKGIVHV